MAHTKSALKRIRQSRKRHALNREHLTRLRHQIKKLRQALEAKDVARAKQLLEPTVSLIDKSIHKSVIHHNTADRYKSRLTRRYQALVAAPQAS